MDVVQFCLKEHIKPGDDLYYALLYSRAKNPHQLVACALFQSILHTSMTIEDGSVRVAKLGWWSNELQNADSDHPLIQFMYQQNHISWLTQAMLPVTNRMLKHPSLLALNNHSFVETEAGLALMSAMGTRVDVEVLQNDFIEDNPSIENNCSIENHTSIGKTFSNQRLQQYAKAVFRFWMLKSSFALSANNALSIPPTAEMINSTLQRLKSEIDGLSIKVSRSNLSPACYNYLHLIKQWLSLNQYDKQSAQNTPLYEPGPLRKLIKVWLVHHFSFI